MKTLLTINFILSITLGYFVYENFKKTNKPNPQTLIVQESIGDFKKELADNKKLIHELLARLEKLDKNVNGHEIGDSLRDQIGGLQSDLGALQKKLR